MKSKTIIFAVIAVLCIVAAVVLDRMGKSFGAIAALIGTFISGAFSIKFSISIKNNISQKAGDNANQTIIMGGNNNDK